VTGNAETGGLRGGAIALELVIGVAAYMASISAPVVPVHASCKYEHKDTGLLT